MSDTPKTVWPTLNYVDARAGISFLTSAFGFVETLVVPGDGDAVAHAELRWPEGGGVMLGSADPEGNEFSRLPSGCASVYVVTDDPQWGDWSQHRLEAAALRDRLAINAVIYAELSIGFKRIDEVETFLEETGVEIKEISRRALFLAGKVLTLAHPGRASSRAAGRPAAGARAG